MGEIAALLTACCWAGSSLFFSSSSRQIGTMNTNRLRLVFAVIYILTAHLLITGQVLPVGAGWQSWAWLSLSGIVGLVIGDGFLFKCYVAIGVRLGTLVMSVVPVVSTLIAWIFLGERLSAIKITGILITVLGIAVVVMERANGNEHGKERRQFRLGLLYGAGGAIGQAVGLVLAKQGMVDGLPTYSSVAIRMTAALVAIWLLAVFSGEAGSTLRRFKEWQPLKLIMGGSMVGPFIGVWLSMVAIQNTYVGIASTLMALTPVVLLPVVKWVFKENVSIRAVGGTLLAMAGVAVIFLGV